MSKYSEWIEHRSNMGEHIITLCYEETSFYVPEKDKGLIAVKTWRDGFAPMYYVWFKDELQITTPIIDEAIEMYRYCSSQNKIYILRNNRDKTNGEYSKLRPLFVKCMTELQAIWKQQNEYIDTCEKAFGSVDNFIEVMNTGKYIRIISELFSALTDNKIRSKAFVDNISWYIWETNWGARSDMAEVSITKQDGTEYKMKVDSFDKLFDLIFDVEEV